MRTKRGDDGQTVVEFVFMLPFILLFLFALIEFGFGFYSFVTVNNATAEAARYAAVGNPPGASCSDENTVRWRARQMGGNLVNCDTDDVRIWVEYENPNGPPMRLDSVQVRVERDYRPITPFPGLMNLVSWGAFPDTIVMRACSNARLEADMPGGSYDEINGDCGD